MQIKFDDYSVEVNVTDPTDHMQKCWAGGVFYEAQRNGLLQWYANNVEKGLRWIDVGACIGNHTLFMWSVMEADFVESWEPVESNYKQLIANISLNGCRDLALPFAASDDHRKYQAEAYGENNSGMYRITERVDGTVRSETIDYVNPLPCPPTDVIKIDVEGHEVHVVRGAMRTLEAYHPLLTIERPDAGNLAALDALLLPLDYERLPIVLNHTPTYVWR